MRTHMKIGRLGVWAQVDCLTASAEAEFARDVEQWGYSALWTPEAMGRDVLVNSAWLLANTRRLVIASGIANIFARDAMAMAAERAQFSAQTNSSVWNRKFCWKRTPRAPARSRAPICARISA